MSYISKTYSNGDVLHASDLNSIISAINSMETSSTDGSSPYTKLYTGKFVQAQMTNYGLNYNQKNRVTMHDAYCLPYDYGITLYFTLPEHFWLGIRHGARADNMDVNSYWFKNGDSFTFPKTSKFYRCSFGYQADLSQTNVSMDEDTTVYMTPDIIEQYIDSGAIAIQYETVEKSNVITRNSEAESCVKALMMDRANSLSNKRDDLFSYPIICHTSDTHGDYYRVKNFFEYSHYLNADINFLTGDLVGYRPENGQQYVDLLDQQYGSGNTFVTLGNHDTYCLTPSGMYETSIQPFEERNGYICEKTPYYYKDIPEHSLRIIAISPYDYDQAAISTNCKFSQTQIDWIIETLGSTPSGYGVCMLMHPPMSSYANIQKPDNFWQHYNNTTASTPPFWEQLQGISGTPIIDIIDSFISRSTISNKTYTNSDGSSFSVTTDFTDLDSSIEFIAYFNGHTHCDVIGYYSTATNPQVVCNVQCGIGCYGTSSYPYWANISDTPRGLVGKTQDAFNVYIIDRARHEIRIGRIGSNRIMNGEMRDFMTINYKEKPTS